MKALGKTGKQCQWASMQLLQAIHYLRSVEEVEFKSASEGWRMWKPNNTNDLQKIQMLRGYYSILMAYGYNLQGAALHDAFWNEMNSDNMWIALLESK